MGSMPSLWSHCTAKIRRTDDTPGDEVAAQGAMRAAPRRRVTPQVAQPVAPAVPTAAPVVPATTPVVPAAPAAVPVALAAAPPSVPAVLNARLAGQLQVQHFITETCQVCVYRVEQRHTESTQVTTTDLLRLPVRFLPNLQLSEYYSLLIQNGFDSLCALELLDDTDLKEMDVPKGHRKVSVPPEKDKHPASVKHCLYVMYMNSY